MAASHFAENGAAGMVCQTMLSGLHNGYNGPLSRSHPWRGSIKAFPRMDNCRLPLDRCSSIAYNGFSDAMTPQRHVCIKPIDADGTWLCQRMARPVCKSFGGSVDQSPPTYLVSGRTLAKMEIRTSWSS